MTDSTDYRQVMIDGSPEIVYDCDTIRAYVNNTIRQGRVRVPSKFDLPHLYIDWEDANGELYVSRISPRAVVEIVSRAANAMRMSFTRDELEDKPIWLEPMSGTYTGRFSVRADMAQTMDKNHLQKKTLKGWAQQTAEEQERTVANALYKVGTSTQDAADALASLGRKISQNGKV